MTAQDALARHRLARARVALEEADLLESAGRWNGALNRTYDDFADVQAHEIKALREQVERFVHAHR